MCVSVHMSLGAHGGIDSPELELQVVVRCLMWVLGIKLRSFGGTVYALFH